MNEPELVTVAREVVKKMACSLVNNTTGERVLASIEDGIPSGTLLLDMQTANLIVTVYEAMTRKHTMQMCIDRWGVTRTVEKCWDAVA